MCTGCKSKLSQGLDGHLICPASHAYDAHSGVCMVSRLVQPDVRCAEDATVLTLINAIDEYSLHPTLSRREVVWRISS